MPDLAKDELLVPTKACGIYGSALQQRDALEVLVELPDGSWPIDRYEVKRVMPTQPLILPIFPVITQGWAYIQF